MGEAVYLALGSNLGDREDNLRRALRLVVQGVHVMALSSLYETEPWGYTCQPNFYNAAVWVETTLGPEELLRFLKGVESAVGPRVAFRNGPRAVDLDLLLYGDRVLREPALIVPHPRMHERFFVLAPLVEIAPDAVHPVRGLTVRQMLAQLGEPQGVLRCWRWDPTL